jgi:hypothetical protein
VNKIIPFRKPRRLTPEIVGELLRIHSSCVHDQKRKCPLLVSVRSLTWELNQVANIGNEEDNAFKVNVAWWDALESVYEREKVVWRLFVGSQPTLEQNKLYAKFREMLVQGSRLESCRNH